MGVYMGLGMDLLASTFDVESVVFFKRGSHFRRLWGLAGGVGIGLLPSELEV